MLPPDTQEYLYFHPTCTHTASPCRWRPHVMPCQEGGKQLCLHATHTGWVHVQGHTNVHMHTHAQHT